ncbi:hypothetical protein RZN21_28170, partial [Klebsiella pneumoniae]|nr:hypothetical protein [Klebsiella pneumoniae]
AQIREILISESAWEEMTCLFAPSLAIYRLMPETERQNLYRVVCLRHKELSRLYEKYIKS